MMCDRHTPALLNHSTHTRLTYSPIHSLPPSIYTLSPFLFLLSEKCFFFFFLFFLCFFVFFSIHVFFFLPLNSFACTTRLSSKLISYSCLSSSSPSLFCSLLVAPSVLSQFTCLISSTEKKKENFAIIQKK
jgi:hypothetical protein